MAGGAGPPSAYNHRDHPVQDEHLFGGPAVGRSPGAIAQAGQTGEPPSQPNVVSIALLTAECHLTSPEEFAL